MIEKEEILKLAGLACLAFTDEELETLKKDMEAMLVLAGEVSRSADDAFGCCENASKKTASVSALREDTAELSIPAEKILSNIVSDNGFFTVKGGL